MSGRGKRLWAPHLDFEGAYHETLQFLKRCEEHQIPLALPAPQLYRAYVIDGVWPAADGQDLTRVLRFGFGNDPVGDRAKIAVARLLAVAVRGHYFLAEHARVPSEPSVFAVPDLAQPGALRYGLVYPMDVPATNAPARQRALVVAEWDLALSAHRPPHVPRGDEFPVVLQPSNRSWLPKSRWKSLRESAGDRPWFAPASNPARRKLLDAVNAHTDRTTFPFGTLLDYPIEIKDDTAATGAMWARGVRSWFLPHGFDTEAVQAYLDRLARMTPEERTAQRWWGRRTEDTKPAAPKFPARAAVTES